MNTVQKQNKKKKNSNKRSTTNNKALKPTITSQVSKIKTDKLNSLLSNINMSKPAESAGELLGKKLGAFAGKLLGKFTGTGDYQTDLPAGGLPIEETLVPQFIKSDNQRETRIRHREFIGSVYASSTAGVFSNTTYILNPANKVTFPWLSKIALQYDQWEPHGAVVIFKSLTSTYAASQSLGTVIIASEYDVYDPPYITKVEMANSEFAVSGNAAQCLMHPIECAVTERMTRVFTVGTPIDTHDNKRFFDLCNIQVASEGCLANQLLGELWLTYDISFYKPQVNPYPTTDLIHTAFTCTNASEVVPLGTIRTFSPYGTPNLVSSVSNFRINFNPIYGGYTFILLMTWPAPSGALDLTGITKSGITYAYNTSLIPVPGPTSASGIPNTTSTMMFTLTPDAPNSPVWFNFATGIDVETTSHWNLMVTIDQVSPYSSNSANWAGPP